ncbi:hypothetical protein [Acrocarpospora sp. B8E8]|uniref:hypothetical protein n=1 Tax=Acrocarpospora sp. B8E8 TaxID=3153572 RepID=UPI00325D21B1
MATKQVTVTIPEDMVELAKQVAARRNTNVSAYTASALRAALVRDAIEQMVSEGYTPLVGLADEVAEDLDVA